MKLSRFFLPRPYNWHDALDRSATTNQEIAGSNPTGNSSFFMFLSLLTKGTVKNESWEKLYCHDISSWCAPIDGA